MMLANRLAIEPPLSFLLQSKAVKDTQCFEPELQESRYTCGAQKLDDDRNESEKTGKKKRKRRVMFEEPPAKPTNKLARIRDEDNDSAAGPSISLRAIEGACDYFRRYCGSPPEVDSYRAFAFFQKPHLSRYVFYVSRGRDSTHKNQTTIVRNRKISLYDFLEAEHEDTITIAHQLKLAWKLALTVLQYHSTPWLGGEWRLSQLMLDTEPFQLPVDFKLYLNSKLIPASPTLPTPPTTPERIIHNEVQMTEKPKKGRLSEAQQYGINNTTLFCLGLALLEISHWKPLSKLVEEDYDTDEIYTARRLSNSPSVIGRSYDEIVRKCLQCNFGFGTDLRRPELQSAFYSDVVCTLEELIKTMDNLNI
jgi:hypothetical protein